jgi:hypothetical protein
MRKKRRKTAASKMSGMYEIIGLLIASLGLFFGLTIYSRGMSAGVVGQLFYPVLKGLFGILSYLLPIIIVIMGILIISSQAQKDSTILNWYYLFLLSIFFFAFIHLLYFDRLDTSGFTRFCLRLIHKGKGDCISWNRCCLCTSCLCCLLSFWSLPVPLSFLLPLLLIGLLILTNLSINNIGIQIYKFLRLNKAVRIIF